MDTFVGCILCLLCLLLVIVVHWFDGFGFDCEFVYCILTCDLTVASFVTFW